MTSEEHRTENRIFVREVPAEGAQEARAERVLGGGGVHTSLIVHPAVDVVGEPDDIDETDIERRVERVKVAPGGVRHDDRGVECGCAGTEGESAYGHERELYDGLQTSLSGRRAREPTA